MKLYTKTGDGGETSLSDGTRVPKDDPRISACGQIDDLNGLLGWVRAAAPPDAIDARLVTLQRELFGMGAAVADPRSGELATSRDRINREACARLERWIDEAVADLPPLKHFALPGGTERACRLHAARTSCRRAERAVVGLARDVEIQPEVMVYLNRLSDLLFAWARRANHVAGEPETLWMP